MSALLRVGSRVRSLIDDGFVSVGLEGTVSSVVHPGYAGNHTGWNLILITWDNSTVCRLPQHAIETIEVAA